MKSSIPNQRASDLISATEIAAWAYCPESWRLECGLGLESGNWQARTAGTRHHARKVFAERIAGAAILLGRLLAFLAAGALLALLWWWL